MEHHEGLQLNILDKLRDESAENEISSSDSEQETESRDTSGTPRSGSSDIGTPRSCTSEESSLVTSPRANLLWDHAFDVANGGRKTVDERDTDWRRFSNKTDDDKIKADKTLKMTSKLQEIGEGEIQKNPKNGHCLPDLIPSASISSVSSSMRSSQETLYAIEELDFPPPLPDSDPPCINDGEAEDCPPPLPVSSPPTLNAVPESVRVEESFENGDFETNKCDIIAIENEDIESDDTNELCNEDPMGYDTDSDDSSSAAGDLSDHDADQRATNFDGFYNVQTNTVFRMEGDNPERNSPFGETEDFEAEFDNILLSLISEFESQETYVERFAGRRDRYGFILSPVIEAPSPTPSNMSGYSGYSGISCSSPDPLGIFRMSPGPHRGSRQELDLSSLCVKPKDWDIGDEQTVPIYQTVQAKRALVIPEGFGWDSGDDLLSPTGSVDWDSSDNGLSTPPVSASFVNLTQFGTHITGWKQPDVAIYEEPENYSSDSTINNEQDSDTDTTIDDDISRENAEDISKVTVTECESPEKNIVDMENAIYQSVESQENSMISGYIDVTDETVQNLELSVLEDGIKEVESELKLLKTHTGRNNEFVEDRKEELYEIKSSVEDVDYQICDDDNGEIISLDSSLNNAIQGFDTVNLPPNDANEEYATSEMPVSNDGIVLLNSSLEKRCRKFIRVGSKQTSTTSDDESDTTEESYEDAEDEYSDSDNEQTKQENVESDFDLFKARPVSPVCVSENEDMLLEDNDTVSVTEILSPRTAILLSGGMFPEETETSSFSSDEGNDAGNVTPDPNMSSYGSGIKISQYTSGDSDDNHTDVVDRISITRETENQTLSMAPVMHTDKNSGHKMVEETNETETISASNKVTIHSPLDFSILDSKLGSHTRGEIRKSPRIFGRYFSEIDDQLLEEVRSKCETPDTDRSELEVPESSISNFEPTSSFNVDEYERSFKQVDITNSSCVKSADSNSRNNGHLQQFPSDYQSKTEIVEIPEKTVVPLPHAKQHSTETCKSNSQQNVDNDKHTKSSPKKPALKIKVGHLIRRSSARSKVKRGFVHELSELFDKSDQRPESTYLHTAVSKKTRVKIERAPTPKTLTPNENLVIFENSEQQTSDNNVEMEDNMEIQVTPLQKVASFEDMPRQERRQNVPDYEKIENNTYSSDVSSIDASDGENGNEIKRYESQLREIQTDDEEITGSYGDETNVQIETINYDMTGTSEFIPCLDSYEEIQQPDRGLRSILAEKDMFSVDDSLRNLNNYNQANGGQLCETVQEEIEERIDGDTDLEQSEDEEFHQRYYLPGHSYHINDTGSEQEFTEKIIEQLIVADESVSTEYESRGTSNCTTAKSNECKQSKESTYLDTSKTEIKEDIVEHEASVPPENIEQPHNDRNTPMDNQGIKREHQGHKTEYHSIEKEAESNEKDHKGNEKQIPGNSRSTTNIARCVTTNNSKQQHSEGSHIDMSSVMWRIPWKTVKERKQETVIEKPANISHENTKPKSGYLYNIISRLNMPPAPTAVPTGFQEDTTSKSEAADDQHPYKNHTKSSDKPENIEQPHNDRNTPMDNQGIKRENQGHKKQYHSIEKEAESNEKDNKGNEKQIPGNSRSTTALSEKGEFDFLDESVGIKKVEPKASTHIDYFPRKRINREFEDDPHFKIRYPSSLSRRLYGPYCRVRAKENVLFEEENERETNPPTLLQNLYRNRDTVVSRLSCQQCEDLHNKNDKFSSFQTEYENRKHRDEFKLDTENFVTESCSQVSDTGQISTDFEHGLLSDSPTDKLPILSVDQNTKSVDFNHTCYDVKTPFSCSTQREGFKFNLKAIIGCEGIQAQQKPLVCENNFVNVKLQRERIEAKRDKQEYDSSKTTHDCKNASDLKLTKLPMHLECTGVCDKTGRGSSKEIINNTLGVDNNSEVVNNDDHYTCLGVHIPPDLSTNHTTQRNVDMNNDIVSTSRTVSSVKANKPRINRSSASETTQNINSHPMSSGDAVTEDTTVTYEYNQTPEADDTHISRASVVPKTPGFQHMLEDERGKLRIWPYSDFDNSDKLPVSLHRVKKGFNISVKKGMSNSINNMTVIQSAEHSAEMPENRVVHKYHSSSILPADHPTGQIMKAHGESVQSVLLQDANGNNVSEEELASVLPKIADSISKMDNSNAEEILPGITQSITKLKNGGNLVITTMTRKLDEDESSSSGRGSPEPDYPVLDVDDLEKSKIYLVQDSKGELFYVEDVTSESQESAYFSSRNTSESVSDTGNSPTFERISKINSVGDSGIKETTAQEILSAMYGDGGVNELKENEEEWSERTYEYDLPRRKDGTQNEYSKDSFKTSYMVEEPGDTLPRLKSATSKDRYESSYQMTGGAPWVYDGGMAQSYSQVTQGVFGDEVNSVSAVSTHNVDNSGVKTIERYTIEGEAIDYPAPVPVFVPPMVVQTDTPQYSLVKVDVTPKHKDEGVMAQIEAPKPEEPTERPIYKTVAHIQTNEKVPSPKPEEKKKYKILASKATEREEEQETHMRFDEIDYKFSAENVEYTMKPATAETQYFVKNTTTLQPPSQFRSEKRIELGRSSGEKFKSQIQVEQPKPEVYEQSSYTYDQMKSELEHSESDMRVVRGSYLIKNSLDDTGTALDDNINMFDRNFTMCKDNPLYHSDEDLYKRLEREKLEHARRVEKLQRDLNHDISFETVDRFSRSKAVKREPEKPRQSLYEMLMSRLSTIEAKDIRQNIDVKHNSEDIYGDPRFLQADGEQLRNIAGTNNFETVGEKVDLILKEGKAYITVKVTAERITPVDLEFNVWRKNQAVVTRTIEVDLLATEKRRRLYYKVMKEPAGGSRGSYRAGPNETVLDSQETLELFTKIIGAADGEGDTEDIEVKTRSGKTTRPFSSGMDLLY